ncbi:MAG: PQQ-binding-like beta-propeller repeat protein [Planctomycetota bacterium]
MRTFPILILLPLLTALADASTVDDWPQWRGPTRDGVWRETGLLEELPDELELRWSVPIGGGYSGPTVADGRVYVTDHLTDYVTDRVDDEREVERVHCFDEESGESLWTHTYDCSYAGVSYEAGPRCSVLIQEGRAYSLGTMGHLFCFDAASGEVLWSHDLADEYEIRMPIWGIAAAPILEEGLLIVPVSGAPGAYMVAFDAETGRERWAALDDRGNYSAPIVIDQAGQRVLVCWTGDRVVGLVPNSGKLLWEHPMPPKQMPLGIASPVLEGDTLFFSGFYEGGTLLRLNDEKAGVEMLWHRVGPNERRTDSLQSIISTPLVRGDHVYGVDSYGELRCLRLKDGERVWEDQTAVPRARWATIHFVQNGERTWMFNERGELIIAELTPEGYHELDRAKLIAPTLGQLPQREGVCWSHPAFANRHVFARNDEVLVCADLSAR